MGVTQGATSRIHPSLPCMLLTEGFRVSRGLRFKSLRFKGSGCY